MESNKTLIRAVVALYAALVGFGLKKMLDEFDVDQMDRHRWWLFVTLLLLAFRIMCGAAVHLTELYAEGLHRANVNRMLFDIFSLVSFAVLITTVTLAKSLAGYFALLTLPLAGAIFWATVEKICWKHPLGDAFFKLNVVSLFVVVLAWGLETGEMGRVTIFGWHASVCFIAIGSLILAVLDVRNQLHHLVALQHKKVQPDLGAR